MTITLPGYYNRFDAQWNYEDILFRPAGLQSAELNELQALQANRLKQVADALFADGDVIRGEPPAINAITGVTICPASVIYINGIMRSVPTRTFTIPVSGVVLIGIYLRSEVIEEDDTGVGEPGLRDPAVGTRNYQEPGAARLRETPTWGHDGEGLQGVFYPVWTVVDGVLQGLTPPDGGMFRDLLARYDRESNGNYIVSGLTVTAIDAAEFSVREGVGNIFGYKIDKPATSRLVFAVDPDLESVTSEPDVYVNASTDIRLNRYPVSSISAVICTKEKTVTITRGGSAGGSDVMPDVSIVSIQTVYQNPTTFTSPASYLLVGDSISWSPGGAEPNPGSTYSVTYRYLTTATALTVSLIAGTFRITGAVAGALVLTDYEWKLPRIDRICLSRNGTLSRVKGISSRYTPLAPRISIELLSLATVYNNWAGSPSVANDGIRAILFNEIENMRTLILNLFDLVAQERLLRDIAGREPTTKRGVFVDPFIDDDMRDAGRLQTGRLRSGALMLPVRYEPFLLPSANNQQDWILPYDQAIILEQSLVTGQEKINPYANYDPIPAGLRIVPAADVWTEQINLPGTFDPGGPGWDGVSWREVDQSFGRTAEGLFTLTVSEMDPAGGRWVSRIGTIPMLPNGQPDLRDADMVRLDRAERETTTTTTTTQATNLRQITIQFFGTLFGAGEALESVIFSGVNVTPVGTITANGAGSLSGSFLIPAGIPVGRHLVTIAGVGGSYAEAFFTGSGTIVTSTIRELPARPVEPLAQTFTLAIGRYITSVDVMFKAKGSTANHVTLQIREVEIGLPTSTIIASGQLAGSAISLSGWTRITFDRPVYVQGGVEHAMVLLTDDNTHAVAIAELGKYDTVNQSWVTAQPYTIGTLLKSSNGSTWTPFQEADLTFRLYGAAFTSNTRTVNLGKIFRLAATSITRSGSIATVTATAHGCVSNQTVTIAGAAQSEYNGAFVVTRTGPNTFTYLVSGTPATPATGAPVIAPGLISDLLVLCLADLPSAGCGVECILTSEDGFEIRTQPIDYVELAERLSAGLSLSVILTGTTTESPYVFAGTSVVLGEMLETGSYISRAFPSGSSPKVVTTFDQYIPSAAAVVVAIEESDLGWLTVTQDSVTQLGDGWLEATHTETSFTDSGTESRVRLTLTGTPASRPLIRNLRVVTV